MKLIYFHIGFQDYLSLSIKQAALHNDVILIGDDTNKKLRSIPNVEFFHYKDLSQDFDLFIKKYQHLSFNNFDFEKLCFLRWIAARNLCNLLGLDVFAFTDSDNLFYIDLTEVHEKIDRPSLALAVPNDQPQHRNAATGEVSYWSKDKINLFCEFLISIYSSGEKITEFLLPKWNWHQKHSKPGGINDMTLLWFFSRKHEHKVITKVHSNTFTIDHNINSSDNFFNF